MKTATNASDAVTAEEISFQSASVDIWDKKYRLKTKSGGALDTDIDATYHRIAKALAEPKNLSNRISGLSLFYGRFETARSRPGESYPTPAPRSISPLPAPSTAPCRARSQTQ